MDGRLLVIESLIFALLTIGTVHQENTSVAAIFLLRPRKR
jgi:hypothetical protein